MRTGLKHLLGMSATLLLLLTVILWVDGFASFLNATAVHNTGIYYAFSSNGEFSVLVDPADLPGGTTSFNVYRAATTDADALDVYFGDSGSFGVAWNKGIEESGLIRFYYGLRIPHWFVAICFGIPAFLYLRFLYRRRRGYAVTHERADEDAPTT